jgi:hypothetical protein
MLLIIYTAMFRLAHADTAQTWIVWDSIDGRTGTTYIRPNVSYPVDCNVSWVIQDSERSGTRNENYPTIFDKDGHSTFSANGPHPLPGGKIESATPYASCFLSSAEKERRAEAKNREASAQMSRQQEEKRKQEAAIREQERQERIRQEEARKEAVYQQDRERVAKQVGAMNRDSELRSKITDDQEAQAKEVFRQRSEQYRREVEAATRQEQKQKAIEQQRIEAQKAAEMQAQQEKQQRLEATRKKIETVTTVTTGVAQILNQVSETNKQLDALTLETNKVISESQNYIAKFMQEREDAQNAAKLAFSKKQENEKDDLYRKYESELNMQKQRFSLFGDFAKDTKTGNIWNQRAPKKEYSEAKRYCNENFGPGWAMPTWKEIEEAHGDYIRTCHKLYSREPEFIPEARGLCAAVPWVAVNAKLNSYWTSDIAEHNWFSPDIIIVYRSGGGGAENLLKMEVNKFTTLSTLCIKRN